ncbi:MAG: ATP phosphoribosyltransferase regulatory subunit [Clostridia bacterium]|nr:ATP phosphoribosyltransferase regulatory subunit [Clostridia bacterium]
MDRYDNVLNSDEKAAFGLRDLYRSYGYRPYKMSKFEEYDLYVRNKDFLVSDNVITFTDTNGRLMALKPDVTLSIIKNGKDAAGTVEKVYYNENVYRISKGTHSYKEIMQVGLECIGDVDDYRILEVLTLAAESLKQISDESVLDLSHLGIVSEVLEASGLSDGGKKEVLTFLGEKNLHGAMEICEKEGVCGEFSDAIKTLITTYGDPRTVLPVLRSMGIGKKSLAQLESLVLALTEGGIDTVRIDFSVINDMRYYNGIVFRGFVKGIPTGILSGGQYDKMMKKLGRKSRAIGFAVYLDLLQQLQNSEEYDVDTVLLYDDTDTPSQIAAALKTLQKTGTVTALRNPPSLKYKSLITVKEAANLG